MQRKKGLFISTFTELIKISSWVTASKMSDNVNQRKKELMKQIKNQKVIHNMSFNENNDSPGPNDQVSSEVN